LSFAKLFLIHFRYENTKAVASTTIIKKDNRKDLHKLHSAQRVGRRKTNNNFRCKSHKRKKSRL